jgi:hypothetical protein
LRRTIVGPLTYVAAIGVSFISAPAALAMYAMIVVYFSVGQISLTRS